MKVFIPTPLRSYVGNRSEVEAQGDTVDHLLRDLDRQFPGVRFRVVNEQDRLRPHMRVFVNGRESRDLRQALRPEDEVHLLQALSGG